MKKKPQNNPIDSPIIEKPTKNGNTLSESFKNFTGLAYSQSDIISPLHRRLILKTKAEAKGNIEKAASVTAVKINKGPLLDTSSRPLLATFAPKIRVGTYRGKTSKDNSNPPLLIPTVKDAPKAPIADRAGVPINKDITTHFKSLTCNPSSKPRIGETTTNGSPSLIWLVRRHHVSALAAKAAAPVGVTMTMVALVTGALWGQPMWGTWWAWDPRLTSFLVLFLFYLGYIALWSAIDNPDTAADLTSMLCIVGSVFAILSRYAVNFWNQGLHQGASLSLDKEKNVADVFYQPLLFSIFGFVFLFLTLVLIGTRTEIRLRRTEALRLRKDSE